MGKRKRDFRVDADVDERVERLVDEDARFENRSQFYRYAVSTVLSDEAEFGESE